jgi:hypothetical protein
MTAIIESFATPMAIMAGASQWATKRRFAAQPRECALNHPAAMQDLEAAVLPVRLTISGSTGIPTGALASFGPG